MGLFGKSAQQQHQEQKARQKAFRSGGVMSAKDAERAARELAAGKSRFQQAKAARAAADRKRRQS